MNFCIEVVRIRRMRAELTNRFQSFNQLHLSRHTTLCLSSRHRLFKLDKMKAVKGPVGIEAFGYPFGQQLEHDALRWLHLCVARLSLDQHDVARLPVPYDKIEVANCKACAAVR